MQSSPELLNSSVSFCPEPCAFPRLGSWSFRSSPGAPPLAPAPAEHRSVPLPFVARSPGLTWGRGPALPTAPSSRSARRRRLGVTAMAGRSGLGHSCHLRNRAARLIPAGLRGEELAWGPPRPPAGGIGRGPWPLPPGFQEVPGQRPGPGDARCCAPRSYSGLGAAGVEPPALSARGACAWPARCDHWGPPPTPAPQSPPGSPSTKESHAPTVSVLSKRKLRPGKV